MRSIKMALGGVLLAALVTGLIIYGVGIFPGFAWNRGLEPADPASGEEFIYAEILWIDGQILGIEQHLEPGSLEVGDQVTLAADAQVYANRGNEKNPVSPEDLRAGQIVGMIMRPDGLIRTVIFDDMASHTGDQDSDTLELVLYFGNAHAIKTGEPGDYGYVQPVNREIRATSGVLRAALEELIRGPLEGDGELERTVPKSLTINSVTIEGGIATIDVSGELITASDAVAGTLGAGIFTQSLVLTATQFDTVEAVMLLVDGEHWDDGHMVWDEPLGPDAVSWPGR